MMNIEGVMAGTQSIMHGALYNATNGQLAATTIADGSTPTTTSALNHTVVNSLNHSGINSLNHTGLNSLSHSGTLGHSGMNSFNHTGMNSLSHTGMNSGMNSLNHSGINSINHTGMNSINHSSMNSLNHSGLSALNHSGVNGMLPAGMGMANTYESNKRKADELDVKEEKDWFADELNQTDIKTEDTKEWQNTDNGAAAQAQTEEPTQEAEEPVIDIMINNVVCSFSVGCHLDLRNIALSGHNVEFRRENGMVTMKLRRPLTTASIWSSGKITCTGSTSELQARIAARRIARCIQKLGYNAKFRNFRIVNVLGTCTMPFGIKITQFSQRYREAASYEPELHPGVTYKINYPKATLKIFSTGSITVTAPSVHNVQSAIEHIYPLVQEFSKERTPEEMEEFRRNKAKRAGELIDYDSDISLSSEEYEDW